MTAYVQPDGVSYNPAETYLWNFCMANDVGPKFDTAKARATVEKGRRLKWWQRKGGMARGFRYCECTGEPISSEPELERMASLVIPPAWEYVRINPFTGGKVQAVGMDTTGRVQYLYNSTFSARQKQKKFGKIARFGEVLPKLRRCAARDRSLDGLPRDRVLGIILRLIDITYFRVGTDKSEVHYETYGVTTLQKRHLTIGPDGRIEFCFVGKSHVEHCKSITDKKLAGELAELAKLRRGRRIFRYVDDAGKIRAVSPAQINSYIKARAGREFSSKDFRTWGGTMLAAVFFSRIGPEPNENAAKKNIVQVVKGVAAELGNTPAVCRESYIHPAVIDAYTSGRTIEKLRNHRFPTSEKALLRLLRLQEK